MEDNNNMADLVQKLLQGSSININGQTIIGNSGTVNYYAGQGESHPHDEETMTRAMKQVSQYIATHKGDVFWSDVFYCLQRRGDIGSDMSASGFGQLVNSHGGPDAQIVRKSGDYQLSTYDLRKRETVIARLTTFFTGI